INPLTGSVRSCALLNEETYSGEFTVALHFHYRQNDIEANVSAALLLFALRDLALQQLSIGSRASIGYGYLDVRQIEIEKEAVKVTIDIHEQKVDDPVGLLAEFRSEERRVGTDQGV